MEILTTTYYPLQEKNARQDFQTYCGMNQHKFRYYYYSHSHYYCNCSCDDQYQILDLIHPQACLKISPTTDLLVGFLHKLWTRKEWVCFMTILVASLCLLWGPACPCGIWMSWAPSEVHNVPRGFGCAYFMESRRTVPRRQCGYIRCLLRESSGCWKVSL